MNLKDHLYKFKIKQSEIARATRISPPMVSQIVNGIVSCPKSRLEILAKFLQISPEEIQANNVLKKRK